MRGELAEGSAIKVDSDGSGLTFRTGLGVQPEESPGI
jgi:hypothetical protein